MNYYMIECHISYKDGTEKCEIYPYRGDIKDINVFIKGYFAGPNWKTCSYEVLKQYKDDSEWYKDIKNLDKFIYLLKAHGYAADIVSKYEINS